MAFKKRKTSKKKNSVNNDNIVARSNIILDDANELLENITFTSLVDLLGKKNHDSSDADNLIILSQNEKKQILDVELNLRNVKNNKLSFLAGKEHEYFNIAWVQYKLFLQEKDPHMLGLALNNMWICSNRSKFAERSLYFLGLWYSKLGQQAAAFTCFFYCAREFNNLSALNKLSEFYENGQQWLAKNQSLADNFKKLIKQQQIVPAQKNADSVDANQVEENNPGQNEAAELLALYQPLSSPLEKSRVTENLVLKSNVDVLLNHEESDCLLAFAKNNNHRISELDFNEAYNEANRIQQKILNPASEIKAHGKSANFIFENLSKIDRKAIKDTLYEKGIQYHKDGDITSSLLLMWKAYEEGHKDALDRLGILYHKDNNYPAAFACLFHSFHKYKKSTANLACFYEDGYGWLPKNKLKAVSLHQLAAEQGYGQSCYFLGAYYKAQGRVEEAIKWITKNISSKYNTNYFDCLYILGTLYFDQANIKKSIECFQKIIDESSDLLSDNSILQTKIDALEKLALTYLYEERNIELALNYCKDALKLDQSSGDLLITQGIIYDQKKEYLRSKISLELAAGKGFLEAYYYLALAYVSDDCFDKKLDFIENLNKAIEYATFYINNEKESFDNIISACTIIRHCLNKKLQIESLNDEEKNKLQENETAILRQLVSTYVKLADNIKPKYKKIMIGAYQHLVTHFCNEKKQLTSSYYLHLSSLLDDLQSQYYLGLTYFKYAEDAIKLNHLLDAQVHYKNAAYYFFRASNQGMIKAKEYLDIILNKETELTQIKSDSSYGESIKNGENERNQAIENRISISAAKMFMRTKDKKNNWKQKKTKITNIIPIKKTKFDQANTRWFDGSFNAKNVNLKEMVYHDGEKPAFLLVDPRFLTEHRANFGSCAASFFENAQFKLSQTNIKPLKGKNHLRHALNIQLPNGEIEEKECRYELKLEGKSRLLLFKVKSDDNEANLYIACEYLKNGLHNKGNIGALKDSEKSGKVVSLNWPK